MSTQFVDINADSYHDILAGSFSGTPYIIMGSEEGYHPPQPILDKNDELVVISAFYNREDEKWDETDRAGPSEGNCTSACLVDWDDDGDLDLLLGNYDSLFGIGHGLYLQLNEGTAQEPAFSGKSTPVELEGETDFNLEGKDILPSGGVAAPKVFDFNADGLFDILIGGRRGRLVLYANIGAKGAPKFAPEEILIKTPEGDIPAANGLPLFPAQSWHVEVVDYDGDGDQDVLVGAITTYYPDGLTDEHIESRNEINEQIQALGLEMEKLLDGIPADKQEEVMESEEYQKAEKERNQAAQQSAMLDLSALVQKDLVWLFRRK